MIGPGYLQRLTRATLCAGLSLGLAGMGPLERNHPAVARGMDAYKEGRYGDALSAFEAAQREKSEAPELDLNRGDALYKLQRLEEARLAYERAAARGDPSLQQRSQFNLGNTLAALGKRQEAVAAYRKALVLDPQDAQARRNLELLLKEGEPPKPKPTSGPDGGTDAGTPPSDAGADAGPDGGGGTDGGADGGGQDGGADGGASDGGSTPGESDGGPDGGSGGQPNEPPPEEEASASAPDAGQIQRERLSEEEVKRLLDSMKESEKSLQLWRFQKKKPRTQNEKDW